MKEEAFARLEGCFDDVEPAFKVRGTRCVCNRELDLLTYGFSKPVQVGLECLAYNHVVHDPEDLTAGPGVELPVPPCPHEAEEALAVDVPGNFGRRTPFFIGNERSPFQPANHQLPEFRFSPLVAKSNTATAQHIAHRGLG